MAGDTGTAEATEVAKKKIGRPKGSKNKKGLGHKNKGYTVSEKALAQRRENRAMPVPKTPDEMDFNNRLINHIMQISEIASHADRNDLNSLKSCFVNYLKLCQQNGFPVQNIASYSAMGFYSSTDFDNFSKRSDPDIRAFAASVRSVCGMFREGMVTEGKLNPVIGIFWQRNFDGLRNDTEQVQAINQEQDDLNNNKGYKEKYRKLIGGE